MIKVDRFERYNQITHIEAYDSYFSRVKMAIDSHCGNKIHRDIKYAEPINNECIIGVTEEWY